MTDIKVGDRALYEDNLVAVKVIGMDGLSAWIKYPSGSRAVVRLDQLAPIPNTVTPTLLREDAEWLVWLISVVENPNIERIVAALKEAL